jgi:hypothetical protein
MGLNTRRAEKMTSDARLFDAITPNSTHSKGVWPGQSPFPGRGGKIRQEALTSSGECKTQTGAISRRHGPRPPPRRIIEWLYVLLLRQHTHSEDGKIGPWGSLRTRSKRSA